MFPSQTAIPEEEEEEVSPAAELLGFTSSAAGDVPFHSTGEQPKVKPAPKKKPNSCLPRKRPVGAKEEELDDAFESML